MKSKRYEDVSLTYRGHSGTGEGHRCRDNCPQPLAIFCLMLIEISSGNNHP